MFTQLIHMFLHLIGMCPDNGSHFDLGDIFIYSQEHIVMWLRTIQFYAKKVISIII